MSGPSFSPGEEPWQRVARLKALARIMDSAYQIPGTSITVGLDSIAGLIPGAGDVATALVSSYVVVEAARLGVPQSLLFRMLFNVGIDTFAGSVPILGDIFDIGWKSNVKNVTLLEQHFTVPHQSHRSNRRFVMVVIGIGIAIIIIFTLLIAAIVAGIIMLVRHGTGTHV